MSTKYKKYVLLWCFNFFIITHSAEKGSKDDLDILLDNFCQCTLNNEIVEQFAFTAFKKITPDDIYIKCDRYHLKNKSIRDYNFKVTTLTVLVHDEQLNFEFDNERLVAIKYK